MIQLIIYPPAVPSAACYWYLLCQ